MSLDQQTAIKWIEDAFRQDITLGGDDWVKGYLGDSVRKESENILKILSAKGFTSGVKVWTKTGNKHEDSDEFVLFSVDSVLYLLKMPRGGSIEIIEICTVGTRISTATIMHESEQLNIWIGESYGRITCKIYRTDLTRPCERVYSGYCKSAPLALHPMPSQAVTSRSYCWAVDSSSIILYAAYDQSSIEAVVTFNLSPAQPVKFFRSQLIPSSQGPVLISYYLSEGGGKQTVLVFAVDTQNACRQAEAIIVDKLSPIASIVQAVLCHSIRNSSSVSSPSKLLSFFSKEEKESVVFAHTTHVYPNLSTQDDSLSTQYSLELLLVGSKGSINLVKYTTPQRQIALHLTSSIDLSSPTSPYTVPPVFTSSFYSQSVKIYSEISCEVITETGYRQAQEERAMVQELSIHQACLSHSLYLPHRARNIQSLLQLLSAADERHELHLQRSIVLEALVAIGEVGEIVQYILHLDDTSEIQRLFDWVAGSDDSLVKSVQNELNRVMTTFILPYLLRENEYTLQTLSPMITLKKFIHIVHQLTEALYACKMYSMVDKWQSNREIVAFDSKLDSSLRSQSVVELFFLHEEMRLLKHIADVVHVVSFQSEAGFINLDILRQQMKLWSEKEGKNADLLPSYLTSTSVLSSLLSFLPSALQLDIRSKENEDSGCIVDYILFLPFHRLVLFKEEVLQSKVYVDKTLNDIARELTFQLRHARVLTLYYLLASFHVQNVVRESLLDSLVKASGCQYEEVMFVSLLVEIDQGVDNEVIAELISRSRSLVFLEQVQWNIMPTIINRLLTNGGNRCAQIILLALVTADHEYVRRPEGVVALVASLPDSNLWEAIWERARALCAELSDTRNQLATRAEVTLFMCKWTIRNKVFSKFLHIYFHPLELEVVLNFLDQRVERDIQQKVLQSPAVDTLVAFLLRIHRIEDAEDIHLRHEKAITGQALNEDARRSILDRQVLIKASKNMVTVPSINYEIIRYMMDL